MELQGTRASNARQDMSSSTSLRITSIGALSDTLNRQDLHLQTATVRESLRFSAMLRQPKSVSKQEKYDYVEEVIKMLNMEDFAEAVVGVPGMGLNVEVSQAIGMLSRLTSDYLLATKTSDHRCRIGGQTEAFAIPRRADKWFGLTKCMGHLCLLEKASRRRSSCSLSVYSKFSIPIVLTTSRHHSPTFRHPFPGVRPATVPRQRRQDGIFRPHW